MKKYLRLTALLLVLVMCLSMPAAATVENGASDDENDLATIYGANGAVVTFASDATDEEKITVTYESADINEGQFYLVMVVAGTEVETGETDENGDPITETVYNPDKDSILYINQTVGKAGATEETGKIVFSEADGNVIYPSTIRNSAILIYGTDIDGTNSSLIAAIIEGKYILGDLDLDGKILAADGVAMSLHLAGLEMLTGNSYLAGDIDKDGKITAVDGVFLRQRLAGIITEF